MYNIIKINLSSKKIYLTEILYNFFELNKKLMGNKQA